MGISVLTLNTVKITREEAGGVLVVAVLIYTNGWIERWMAKDSR